MMRYWLSIFVLAFVATSCYRSSDEIWDDTKSASRHLQRGIYALGGKHGDTRQVRSREEFMPSDASMWATSKELDFVPIPGEENHLEIAMNDAPFSPGDPGSRVPGIDAFQDSSTIPQLSSIFKTVYFPYDSNYLQGSDQLSTLKNIAAYLKDHPATYVFITGNCDERGSESYNLALGSRRANTVRNFLIKEGVQEQQLFTISYGKDRPIANGHNEDAWAKNRRVEFKIYEQHKDATHFGRRAIPNAGNLSASW